MPFTTPKNETIIFLADEITMTFFEAGDNVFFPLHVLSLAEHDKSNIDPVLVNFQVNQLDMTQKCKFFW